MATKKGKPQVDSVSVVRATNGFVVSYYDHADLYGDTTQAIATDAGEVAALIVTLFEGGK